MPKAYYTEYVNHCLRFYARYPSPKFRSNVDEINWKACAVAFSKFKQEQIKWLLAVYKDAENIPLAVGRIAKENRITADTLWKLVSDLEQEVAICRGLI